MPSPRRILGLAAVAVLGCGGEDCPPPEGEWRPISLLRGPGARDLPAVVWTGAEMIVWGGLRRDQRRADGARYRPSTDEWVAMADGPVAMTGTAAVWTGVEMIVWDPSGAGAAYHPGSDRWRAIATDGQPGDLAAPLAVWTGAEMIVLDQLGARGGRYHPAADRWAPVASDGPPAENVFFGAVWTGDEAIVWGAGQDFVPAAHRYHAAADRWSPIEANQAMSGAGVWTGRELFFAGGGGEISSMAAARYDPAADRWREAARSFGPAGIIGQTAAWTGERVIVWGGTALVGGESREVASGALYDPEADAWTPMAQEGAPSPRARAAALWTGSELVVWGGMLGGAARDDGARFTPRARSA